jgi:hypothetical protein
MTRSKELTPSVLQREAAAGATDFSSAKLVARVGKCAAALVALVEGILLLIKCHFEWPH